MVDADYCNTGSRIFYYTENGTLYICSPATAKKRWLDWWNNLSIEEKKIFNEDISIRRANDPPRKPLIFRNN